MYSGKEKSTHRWWVTTVYLHLLPNSTKEKNLTIGKAENAPKAPNADIDTKVAVAQTLGCNPHAVQENGWAHRTLWSSLMSGGCRKSREPPTRHIIWYIYMGLRFLKCPWLANGSSFHRGAWFHRVHSRDAEQQFPQFDMQHGHWARFRYIKIKLFWEAKSRLCCIVKIAKSTDTITPQILFKKCMFRSNETENQEN